MCFQHIGNSFPAVQCLFYWQSFYFCPSLLSLSVPNIWVMLNCISAVSGGQLIFFKMIAFFKFFFQKWLHFLSSLQLCARLLYRRLSCDGFDVAPVPQIPPLIDSHKQFQNILFDKYLSPHFQYREFLPFHQLSQCVPTDACVVCRLLNGNGNLHFCHSFSSSWIVLCNFWYAYYTSFIFACQALCGFQNYF